MKQLLDLLVGLVRGECPRLAVVEDLDQGLHHQREPVVVQAADDRRSGTYTEQEGIRGVFLLLGGELELGPRVVE